MTTIKIQDYHIFITPVTATLKQWLEQYAYKKIFVLVDENTKLHCLPMLEELQMDIIQIAAGEQHKNIETLQYIWAAMLANGADRHSLLINLGGGVIGDMGGFAAATYMRGIDFVQIPTTLLSQVDSSIGGKLGIDFNSVKNSVGVFRNPKAVFIDTQFLKTLSERELQSGYAEIIKHALIDNQPLWKTLLKRQINSKIDFTNLDSIIKKSLQIKKRIVLADPFERGIRKALNFGHTIGHALESICLTSEYALLHGEAIVLGMLLEAKLSTLLIGLSQNEMIQINHFFQIQYPSLFQNVKGRKLYFIENIDAIIKLMQADKKNKNGAINCSLLPTIGSVSINQEIAETLMREILLEYCKE